MKMNRKYLAVITLAVMLLSVILSSTVALAATGSQGNLPVIEVFSASQEQISPGEMIYLNWKVVNAARVELYGLTKEPDEELQLEGEAIDAPMTTTTYTLVAYGFNGDTVKQTRTVTVSGNPPVIESFTASQNIISPGDVIYLNWKVANAARVELYGLTKEPDEELQLEGEAIDAPMVTTTYTLVAYGFDGGTTKSGITVTVVPHNPEITSFTASQTQVKKGELVQLSWATTGAVKCVLQTDQGYRITRPVNGSVWVTPNKTTTYTLLAVNSNGKLDQASVTVTIVKHKGKK
ncbi:MAG: hypothetical protein ACM3PP_09805 [Candidatus Saccharibacteria bacterium]